VPGRVSVPAILVLVLVECSLAGVTVGGLLPLKNGCVGYYAVLACTAIR